MGAPVRQPYRASLTRDHEAAAQPSIGEHRLRRHFRHGPWPGRSAIPLAHARTGPLLALTLLTFPRDCRRARRVAGGRPGGAARLISSDVLDAADGTTLVALELDMPADTQDLLARARRDRHSRPRSMPPARSASSGHEILWPYPLIETKGGLTDFVYRGPTVLPVRADARGRRGAARGLGGDGHLLRHLRAGHGEFHPAARLRQPDRGQGLRIAQAVALTPIAWDRGAAGAGRCAATRSPNAAWSMSLTPESIRLAHRRCRAKPGQLFRRAAKKPGWIGSLAAAARGSRPGAALRGQTRHISPS